MIGGDISCQGDRGLGDDEEMARGGAAHDNGGRVLLH